MRYSHDMFLRYIDTLHRQILLMAPGATVTVSTVYQDELDGDESEDYDVASIEIHVDLGDYSVISHEPIIPKILHSNSWQALQNPMIKAYENAIDQINDTLDTAKSARAQANYNDNRYNIGIEIDQVLRKYGVNCKFYVQLFDPVDSDETMVLCMPLVDRDD